MTRKEKTDAFNRGSPDDRQAYLDKLSDDERKKFTKDLRAQAVQDFWNNERDLIKKGECTRDWTPEQAERILNKSDKTGKELKNAKPAFEIDDETGKPVKKDGKFVPYEGHHMQNVKDSCINAGDWKNIQALTKDEHIKGAHDGNTKGRTYGYYDPDAKKTHEFASGEIGVDYPPKRELPEETRKHIDSIIGANKTTNEKSDNKENPQTSQTKGEQSGSTDPPKREQGGSTGKLGKSISDKSKNNSSNQPMETLPKNIQNKDDGQGQ